jgi:dATP pyrophosphohydrolase
VGAATKDARKVTRAVLPTEPCVAVSVYVLRRRAGATELLFLRRSGGRFEGQWWPVTGTRAASEDPVQCALRELREETGLSPNALYQTDLTAPVEGGGHLRIFVAPVDASDVIRINWEHDAHRWCSTEEAHAIVAGFPKPIVREVVKVFEADPPQPNLAERV